MAKMLKGSRRLYVSSTLLAQLSVLLSIPVVTRNFTAIEVGAWQYWLVLLGLAASVGSLRYDILVFAAPSEGERERSLKQGLLIAMVVGPVVAIAMFPLLQGRLPVVLAVLFLALGSTATAMFAMFNSWALTKQRYRASSVAALVQGGFTSAGQAVVSLWGATLMALVAVVAIGRGISVVVLSRSVDWDGSGGALWRKDWRFLRKTPWSTVLSTLLAQLILALPIMYLAHRLGPDEFGYAALAWRIAVLPMSLVGGAIAQLVNAEVGRASQFGRDRRSVYKNWLGRLSILAAVAAGTMAIFALFGTRIALGGDWERTGVYLLSWIPIVLCQVVASPLSQVLSVAQRRGVHLATESARLVILVIGFLISSFATSPVVTVFIVALATGAGYLLQIVTSWLMVGDRNKNPEQGQVLGATADVPHPQTKDYK